MPRKSTTVKAKHTSVCCKCGFIIYTGNETKVYKNIWMHPKCCDMEMQAARERKELMKPPNGDLWDKKLK